MSAAAEVFLGRERSSLNAIVLDKFGVVLAFNGNSCLSNKLVFKLFMLMRICPVCVLFKRGSLPFCRMGRVPIQKYTSQGIGRQGIALKPGDSLQKDPMPGRHMPLLVQL